MCYTFSILLPFLKNGGAPFTSLTSFRDVRDVKGVQHPLHLAHLSGVIHLL
jgi:hypothetical protein